MYFFIDPTKLTTQLAEDTFGPLSTNLSNIYNTTSRFQLTTEAKAFACQTGMMIVQQSKENDSLVNLIIKPNNNSELPVDVAYYVYRGILKDSLILDDGTNCEIQNYTASTSNDLIKRIREEANVTDFGCNQLGYDNSLLDTDLIDDVFLGKRTPNNPVLGTTPIPVIDGEWIGTFSKDYKIGFEIVLKSDFNNFNIGFLRASNNQVDVSFLTGFTQRLKREEILQFIDPAAFYGMYFSDERKNASLKYYGNSNVIYGLAVYTNLVSKFYTKNKVYVDIRSEKGYSYNFYQNYKGSATDANNIQMDPAPSTNPETPMIDDKKKQYETNDWPILIVESSHPSGNSNKLRLKLRISPDDASGTDNTKPIIYASTNLKKTHVKFVNETTINSTEEGRHIKTDDLIKNGNSITLTDWTNEFRIYFPNNQNGSTRNYSSNYVRLHYFRTVHNENTTAGVLTNTHYYDSAFCAIDIPQFNITDSLGVGHVESANPIYVREPLHYNDTHPNYNEDYNIEGTGNFELNMINGAYWENGKVLLYARIEYENTAKTSEKEYVNTYEKELSSFTSGPYKNVKNRLQFICREYEITGNETDTKILGINFFKSSDLSSSGKNYKENCMLLGLTTDEMLSIKADTQLGNEHQKYIHLEAIADNPQQDASSDNHRYFAYLVRLQGFNANQEATIITPQHNGNDILVYSRDNQFFHSYKFSIGETVTLGENRIEFHVYHDGIVKVTDNLDFALALKYTQNRVLYFYHSDTNITSEIQGLDENQTVLESGLVLVMANKMERGGIKKLINPIPAGYTSFVNYRTINVPNVDAKESYQNNDGNIFTIGSGSTSGKYYNNLNKKRFMVRVVSETQTASNGEITNFFRDTTVGYNLQYRGTLRLYANPALAGAVIGSLIRINHNITSGGFAYKKGSCYPSKNHVNGEAFDTGYTLNSQNDISFINALNYFGFNNHYIGDMPYHLTHLDPLQNTTVDYGRPNTAHYTLSHLHDNHLHSEQLVLNDGNKDYPYE